MKSLVQENKIVFCESDKDGKTIVVDFDDYVQIIQKELTSYKRINTTKEKVCSLIEETKSKAEELATRLFYANIIGDDLLYGATGFKVNSNNEVKRVTGPKAKYFSNMDLGYVYPLFKTHKLNPEAVQNCKIDEIPIRLVQSAGHTYLSRITSMLNEILSPISISYCRTIIDEYCRDSADYIDTLFKWKDKEED